MIKKNLTRLFFIGSLIAVCICGYYWYQYRGVHPSTDDAYLQANMVNIAPQISGVVSHVAIKNHDQVKAKDLLFEIDSKPYEVALNKAKADLVSAIQGTQSLQAQIKAQESIVTQQQAQLVYTQKQYDRTQELVKQKLYPQSQGDEVTSQLKVAQASLQAAQDTLAQLQAQLGESGVNNASIQAAKAAVNSAHINLSYTKVYSPSDGQLENVDLQEGNPVVAFQELFSIVKQNKWWVSANFKETQLKRIRVGQPVTIKIDMYPDQTFHGTITSFSSGSGASFALLPPENATGNWIKVTQRFPVWISVTENPKYPFRLGASCTATVDTSKL